MTTARTHLGLALLAVCAVATACAEDDFEPLPICDDIGWELGIETSANLPAPELEIECHDGWGNNVETRPAIRTVPLPGMTYQAEAHPAGGWIIVPRWVDPAWAGWFEALGIEVYSLLWLKEDGESFGWTLPEGYSASAFAVVGDELWTLGEHHGDGEEDQVELMRFDLDDGSLLESRPWEIPGFPSIIRATPGQDSAWVFSSETSATVDTLYLSRLPTFDTTELVAMRERESIPQFPGATARALPDGGLAWTYGAGIEVLNNDGSLRWIRDEGTPVAVDDDSLLIASRAPGEDGVPALVLERSELETGEPMWTRVHQRFALAEGESCTQQSCAPPRLTGVHAQSTDGFLLSGAHPYPSANCPNQPLVMAITGAGEVEWAHRVEVCGYATDVIERNGSVEFIGEMVTFGEQYTDGFAPHGAWLRRVLP